MTTADSSRHSTTPSWPPEAPARILVVEDSPDSLHLLCSRLRLRGYLVDEAVSGEEAMHMVEFSPPDLLLLDVMLPGIDGHEVVRRLKAIPELPFIPVILVTGRDSTPEKVAGLDAGADDYLVKPVDLAELEARVRSMLRIKRLQTQLEEKNRELERLSRTDGLTGLFNQRHIRELLNDEFERVRRSKEPLAIALIDFDDLKRVNDTLGHQTGDQVLVEMARLLHGSTRRVDRVGRSGGDEFLVLLPQTPMQGAVVCLERIRKKVEVYPFIPDGDGHLPLTISVGLATCPDPGVQSPEELLRRADVAMYTAKHSGRNRIFPFAGG
jgi:two-component system, cell cycle response regulator